jgi:group I intron endonuclease
MQYIYLLTFPNKKYYVGRTNNYESRMIKHQSRARLKSRHELYWAINKYGWDNITKEIIDTVDTLEEAVAKEYERIVEYNSVRNGYNMTENTKVGGYVWVGREDSEEFFMFKEQMKIAMSGENNGMYGKTHTEETKTKQRERAKGRFSLSWFIEKYGEKIGKEKYEERRIFLKSRNMKRSSNGTFI